MVAIGGVSFYLGYRFGRSSGTEAAPRTNSPRDCECEPSTSIADQHFTPRSVSTRRGNFLANPGFEDGEAGWRWLDWSTGWGPFKIGTNRTSSGSHAAHLPVRGGPGDPPTRVFGVVQELVSPRFPTRITGRYFVERWEPGGTRKVYIQVAIIAMRRVNRRTSTQIRYILAGVTEQPYNLNNARYVFTRRWAQPAQGRWIDFSFDVSSDYRRLWDYAPPDGTPYRVLFEARYDDRPEDATVAADVWYDDLFVGVP